MRRVWLRFVALFRHDRLDRDLQDQVESHIGLLEDEYVARGMSRADARARARRDFGAVESMKEVYRDSRTFRFAENVWQDVRHAARGLRNNPGFTAAAVLSIALGIGANSAIFSLVNAVLLNRLPVAHPEELISIKRKNGPPYLENFSYPLFLKIREQRSLFQDVAATPYATRVRLRRDGQSTDELAWSTYASGNYFSVLGVRPAIGRLIDESDARYPGPNPVAVLSYGYWRDHFGSSASVLGKTVRVTGSAFTIIGIAGPGFEGVSADRPVDVWLPLGCYDKRWLSYTSGSFLNLIGRRRPYIPDGQVQAALQTLYNNHLQNADERRSPWYREMTAQVIRVEGAAGGFSTLKDQFGAPLRILLALTGVLLTIACANVAGLLIARSSARQRDIAVRLSIGASRGRILQQWLIESLLLGVVGGAAGTLIAVWSANALVRFLPASEWVRAPHVSLDERVVGFTALISLLSAVGFGGFSAWRALSMEPAGFLKQAGVDSRSGKSRLVSRRALTVAQVASSFVMLVAAALFVRTLFDLRQINPGFESGGVLTFGIGLPQEYPSAAKKTFHDGFEQKLSSIPGVTAVATGDLGPFRAGRATSTMTVFTPQGPREANIDRIGVTPQYFDVLGVPVIRGTGFVRTDPGSEVRPVIVNTNFAKEFFGDRDPVGSRLALSSNLQGQIVGVVPEIRHYGLRERAGSLVYILDRDPIHEMVLVRAAVPPDRLIATIREEAKKLDPNAMVDGVRTLAAQVDDSLMQERLLASLSTGFALLAVLLAAVGLYGLLSYLVLQRTGEIGIRIALGATRRNIVGLVLNDAARMLALGIAIGVIAAAALTRVISTQLYGVKPNDPWTMALAGVLLLSIGTAAALIPCRRAAGMNPVRALRQD